MITPFIDFVRTVNKIKGLELVGAEIGVRHGANALNMLQDMPIKKLFLVDGFNVYDDKQDGGMFTKEVQNAEYIVLLVDVAGYNNVEIVKKDSEEAIKMFKDESLDFVYIDGAHDYKNVKKDMEWGKKVKHGGFIGGHDYDPHALEVIQAVNEFVAENNYKLIILEPRPGDRNGVEWVIVKP